MAQFLRRCRSIYVNSRPACKPRMRSSGRMRQYGRQSVLPANRSIGPVYVAEPHRGETWSRVVRRDAKEWREGESMKVAEPEIVPIETGPVILGVPEFPAGARVPQVWKRQERHVPRFGIAKHTVTTREMLSFAAQTGYAVDERL